MSLLQVLALTAVSALVVDDDGAPLEGVAVAGIDSDRWTVTAADGRFKGSSSSPRLAFRKAGYQTVIVKPAEGMVIVMPSAAAPAITRCRWERNWDGTRFELPGNGGREFHDVDYSGRSYEVKTATGRHYLQHGHGPLWSFGNPEESDLRKSVEYEETRYKDGVTRARGTLPDGTRWRFLGLFGETISYATKDAEAARKLDAIFDAACVAKPD
ncbi:MAG: carboxypeptidase regulatory-like domain-containing protein [Bryobacterales bacterium]|nr:carboxypeptidase regulatory-like domain-containing protein [Bryobacterales bacterium]